MSGVGRAGSTVGGKYRLGRLLGEGGMGEVYEAQHAVIGRRFAIKFLHAHLTRNAELMERFQREAQAAGALENENIAAAVDFGMADDGAPFLVMEFLEGEDLSRLLARAGTLSTPRAVNIVIQACRGLLAAHDRQIVHRDLKPENLFICRRNDGSDLVKVLDFGIAKLRDRDGVTRSGATMGTPAYMSPEQARGARDVDYRTDIYALGVILYELLSGAKPHPGTSYNEIIFHIMTEAPKPLASLGPVPPGLCAVVERAMLREASARFPSLVELVDALAPFADHAPTPLRTQTVVSSEPSTNAASSAGGTRLLNGVPSSAPASRPSSPHCLLTFVLPIGVVAAGAAALALHRSPAPKIDHVSDLSTIAPPDAAAERDPDDARSANTTDAVDARRPSAVDARTGRLRSVHLGSSRPAVDDAQPAPSRKNPRPFDRDNPYEN